MGLASVAAFFVTDSAPRSDTTRCSLLTAHCSLLTTHHSLLTTDYSPLTTHCSLLTAHCSLLTAHCSLLTAHYSLLTTHHSPLTTHHSPLSTTHPSLLTAHYLLLCSLPQGSLTAAGLAGQNAPTQQRPTSAPFPPRGVAGGSGRRSAPSSRHRATRRLSHCLGCASQPPQKPRTPLLLHCRRHWPRRRTWPAGCTATSCEDSCARKSLPPQRCGTACSVAPSWQRRNVPAQGPTHGPRLPRRPPVLCVSTALALLPPKIEAGALKPCGGPLDRGPLERGSGRTASRRLQ